LKKETKIVIITLVLLIVIAVPLYLHLHSDDLQDTVLRIEGNVNNPINLTLNELKDMEPTTVDVELVSSSRPEDSGTFTYVGATLWSLLELADISEEAESVYIEAIDSYGITININDIKQNQQAVLAYSKNDEPLAPFAEGGEGPLRLIIGSDQYAQRWIKSVARVEVR
jgi:DMSO/TMAO reductase YedYZ molybdopterin-dependent catalytic subunit